MEFLVFIGVMWLIFKIAGALNSADSSGGGSGSSSSQMSALQLRFSDKKLGDKGDGMLAKEVEALGLIPLRQELRIGFITSVFDKTSGELEPVISSMEVFQEDSNIIYQHTVEVGRVPPNQGFVKWVRVGVVLPGILQPPYGGRRKMMVVVRLVNLDNPPPITHGFNEPNHAGLLWQSSLEFEHFFAEKGYSEAAEHRDESRALAIKIAMAVATSDGSLDDAEGEVIKHWIVRAIEPFSEGKQEALKALYNRAMRDAYQAAMDGNLSLSEMTSRLNEIGEGGSKYEVIELCFDVMAADGVAGAEELLIIRRVAEALGLDMDEIEAMRDKKIITLNSNVSSHASIEDLLGIEAGWGGEQIKKHLRTEFQKWNNRLNTLPDGDERQNAQRMLDLISEARKKYV